MSNTRSALISAGRSSIWLDSTCAARLWCARSFRAGNCGHFTANLQVELIGMESCGGAHCLGWARREQGHEVRRLPAPYVKPYLKTNNSDYIDAKANAEAVGRPKMRFLPIKTDDQLDLQSLHRVREHWAIRSAAIINLGRRKPFTEPDRAEVHLPALTCPKLGRVSDYCGRTLVALMYWLPKLSIS
jgi:transposase